MLIWTRSIEQRPSDSDLLEQHGLLADTVFWPCLQTMWRQPHNTDFKQLFAANLWVFTSKKAIQGLARWLQLTEVAGREKRVPQKTERLIYTNSTANDWIWQKHFDPCWGRLARRKVFDRALRPKDRVGRQNVDQSVCTAKDLATLLDSAIAHWSDSSRTSWSNDPASGSLSDPLSGSMSDPLSGSGGAGPAQQTPPSLAFIGAPAPAFDWRGWAEHHLDQNRLASFAHLCPYATKVGLHNDCGEAADAAWIKHHANRLSGWVAFASPSAVKAFIDAFPPQPDGRTAPDEPPRHSKLKALVIGPTTAKAARPFFTECGPPLALQQPLSLPEWVRHSQQCIRTSEA